MSEMIKLLGMLCFGGATAALCGVVIVLSVVLLVRAARVNERRY